VVEARKEAAAKKEKEKECADAETDNPDGEDRDHGACVGEEEAAGPGGGFALFS